MCYNGKEPLGWPDWSRMPAESHVTSVGSLSFSTIAPRQPQVKGWINQLDTDLTSSKGQVYPPGGPPPGSAPGPHQLRQGQVFRRSAGLSSRSSPAQPGPASGPHQLRHQMATTSATRGVSLGRLGLSGRSAGGRAARLPLGVWLPVRRLGSGSGPAASSPGFPGYPSRGGRSFPGRVLVVQPSSGIPVLWAPGGRSRSLCLGVV